MAVSILSSIPQIEKILQKAFISSYIDRLSRPIVTDIIRDEVKSYKKYILSASTSAEFSLEQLYDNIEHACWVMNQQRLQRVINGTGVIVHTNLGRSPINAELWQSVEDVNTHYNNLEIDLSTGKRGKRKGIIQTLMAHLVKGEDTLVVNNNASSVYLMLHELTQGKEVIVSRGEQIQIGGGFRIPDILALSGAKLVEVGTTNITTNQDYLDAITENTAMVLMIHTSNFKIRGFTESADIKELAKELPPHVILAVDQGSGTTVEDMPEEPTVASYIHAGADIVCFSGDKILGGPQAGLITGEQSLIQRLEKNPMMRAFRPSRIVYSLLEELAVRKLNQLESGAGVAETKSTMAETTLKDRAEQLAEGFNDRMQVIRSEMTVGGGSLPDQSTPSWSVELIPQNAKYARSPEKLLNLMRGWPLPVIGVIKHDKVQLNLATIDDSEIAYLRNQLTEALQ
ncbi:L-seryl-tRNA(Sec) selenium transferase [Photobacterium sanguinicancri]|uniref:L-seryl-tRNA(Sec) selenium transferase n=1 Tax=Photobacterium sanguinicancri TaxID=875932 RepID=UPI0026E15D31|nr:L-seryl-tRNA(Sec) selenium transferase [Photobacterium sanguinicancri]MDO6497893.1 L-seryl-tRNA(Sec) selenium transferase [Photobacterium sanguinicancri]